MADINPKDPSNFHRMIVETPTQFQTGFELAKDIKVAGEFKNIVISGMGGSALPGNLLRIYTNDLAKRTNSKAPGIFLNRTYTLPPESFDNSLNIVSSYSGNTEETISSFREVLKHNLPCIGMSSGGEIEKICKENNIPHIKLPIPFPNFQPRIGTGYFIAALVQILVNHDMVTDEISQLLNDAESLKGEIAALESAGQTLAKKLVGKTPIVYANAQYKAVAMVAKIKFNENAKTPAFWNFFPELNHNEMVGHTNPQAKFFVIMLRDLADNPQNLKRYTATKDLISAKGLEVEIIDMPEGSPFYKIFWSIILADFTSYNLALEYNQDPTPVDMVEDLKKILAQ